MNKGINEIQFHGNQIKFFSNGYEIEDFSIEGTLVIAYDDDNYEEFNEDIEPIKGKIFRGYFCKSLGNKWKVEVRKNKWNFIPNVTKIFETRDEAEKYIIDFENE